MYGFIDVANYQNVVVTDASKGIEIASQNYLNSFEEEIKDDTLIKKEIKIKKINEVVKSGNTYYYILDDENNKYKISIDISDNLPFLSNGDIINVGYYDSDKEIIEIIKIY